MREIYKKFLWYIGYSREEGDKDTLSATLARQKRRLGKIWWILSIGTLFCLAILLALLVWLVVHIAKFRIKK